MKGDDLPNEAAVALASDFSSSARRVANEAQAAVEASATHRHAAEKANRETTERLNSEQRRLGALLDAGQRRIGSGAASTASASAAARDSLAELDAGRGRHEPFFNPGTLAYLRRLLGALLTRESVAPALLALLVLFSTTRGGRRVARPQQLR